jgi:hypothetical protein
MQQLEVNSLDDFMLQSDNNTGFNGITFLSFFKIPINFLMPSIQHVFSSFHSYD